MKVILSFLLATLLLSFEAHAEYRVFLLKISKAEQPDRFVPSTLDPLQYPLYYPLNAGETVSYTETWRCRGRTDYFKDYCPNPRAPASTEAGAAGAPAPNQGPAAGPALGNP